MKRLTLGIVSGTAALALFAGTGTAHAAITAAADKFPGAATYADKKLSVTITNNAAEAVDCRFFVFDVKDLATLEKAVDDIHTAFRKNDGAAIAAISADIATKTTPLSTDDPTKPGIPVGASKIAPGKSATGTWTNPTDRTEFTVVQACFSLPDETPDADDQGGTPTEPDMLIGYSAYKAPGTSATGTTGATGGNSSLGNGSSGNSSLDLGGLLGNVLGSLG